MLRQLKIAAGATLAACILLCSAAAPAAAADNGTSKPAAAKPAANPLAVYLARDYVFVDSSSLEAYLATIVQRLMAVKPTKLAPPRVLIFSSEALDAFSDASGNLVVSTGTLRALGNEDELAALLAHELSHLILKHPQQKDALRAFPVGVETMESVAAAAKSLKGSGAPPKPLANDATPSLPNTYAANLVWSDILAPGWNRKQEHAADQNGFELMRQAGYDPAAFGTLFPKLADASAKRSKRLETLKSVMLARAKASTRKALAGKKTKSAQTKAKPGDIDLATPAAQLAENMRGSLTEGAVEGLINGLASFNRDYDSPDQRQAALAAYAEEHRLTTRPKRAASGYKTALKQGDGASLLALDAAAIRLLTALNGNDAAAGQSAASVLLPAAPGGKARFTHLNLAAGTWYQTQQRADLGEQHAASWLTAKQPPAKAYLWMASYQAGRKDYAGAIATLERGRSRVGDPAPFLPQLVSMAKAAGRKQRAEQLTMECDAQDKQNAGMRITSMFRGERVPSGLYAECVARLGYEPQAKQDENAALHAIKHPVQFGKDVTDKVRGKLSGVGR